MLTRQHPKAATTPSVRKAIQESKLSDRKLAKKYSISVDTVRKWRSRNDVYDLSHARHNLGASLNDLEEKVVLELRLRLRLSIDDIVTVVHRGINPELSRSAIYRCLVRNKANQLKKKEKRPFLFSL